MNKTLKYGLLLMLSVCLVLLANRSWAQFVAEDNPQAKAITAAMQNSADQWNRGDLENFMLMYDPSATMMSLCLFPDTKGRYPSH